MLSKDPLLRRFILFGTPLTLGLLQLWHPAHVSYQHLLSLIDWWLFLHIVQLPLFGLLALTIYTLINGIDHVFATISRIGLGLFVVFYIALDAILGVAGGILIQYGSQLSFEQQIVIEDAYVALFLRGGELLNDIAVYSWFVAGLSAAIALYIKGKNHVGVVFLGLGTLFYFSHAFPYGPLAMLCLLVAVITFEFFPEQKEMGV